MKSNKTGQIDDQNWSISRKSFHNLNFLLLTKQKKLILNQKFSITEKIQKCFVEINRLFVVLRKTYKGKKICFKRISSFPGGEIVKSSRHLLNTNFLFNLCCLVMISRWMRKDFLLWNANWGFQRII